jgi:hypothetical protein
MSMKKIVYFIISGLCALPAVQAKEYVGDKGGKIAAPTYSNEMNKILSNCGNTTVSLDMAINNVRTRIYTKGDMWWDLSANRAAYIVPKNNINRASSLFAGVIWFGGRDGGNNLRVAAMTYRSSGSRVDFWPGPLDPVTAAINSSVCNQYDKFFNVKKRDVKLLAEYVKIWETQPVGTPFVYDVPASVLNWPGNFPVGTANPLAPFRDRDGDGIYEPRDGDYPNYDLQINGTAEDCLDRNNRFMYGDETYFWVFNDVGNTKTASGTSGIGMEIRSQAFAYQSNDELNDMTFYSHELVNKGQLELDSMFFGVWTDADLGGPNDDYIGCDASNGFGFLYNADPFDAFDAGTPGYLDQLPAVGIDFFRGPFRDSIFDVNGDGTIQPIERSWDMQFFTYFNNNTTAFGDPTNGQEYYNYLTGKFRDGSNLVYGRNGIPQVGGVNIPTRYCYPGTSDPSNRGTGGVAPANIISGGWTEENNGQPTANAPADRRFVQSAGPFKLTPGARNYITTGVPWAQTATKGDNKASISLLRLADVKAQNLFDACFIKFEDVDAPAVKITEVNQGFHCYLYNERTSNNYGMQYSQVQPAIPLDPATSGDLSRYKFEGYIVYQLIAKGVSNNELNDPAKAKPVFSTNVKNGITQLTNYVQQLNPLTGKVIYVPEYIQGLNNEEGIKTNFFIENDLFAGGKLVNEKTYFYAAIAYSYNNYKEFNPLDPVQDPDPNLPVAITKGQNIVYRPTSNATLFSITPRRNINTANVGDFNYAFQNVLLPVTRVEGQGISSGLTDLKFDASTEDVILENGFAPEATYEGGKGPVQVKILDPARLSQSKFSLKFGVMKDKNKITIISEGDNNPAITPYRKAVVKDDSTFWVLTNETTGARYTDNSVINFGEEIIIIEEGISLKFKQSKDYFGTRKNADYLDPKLDYFSSTISYADPSKAWLRGIKDDNALAPKAPQNWLISGVATNPNAIPAANNNEQEYSDIFYSVSASKRNFADSAGVVSKGATAGWGPYCFSMYNVYGGGLLNGTTLKGGQPTMDMIIMKVRHREITRGRWKFLSNVDLVITDDRSKWSRCPVIEMGDRPLDNEGQTTRFRLRSAPSVDKDGNADASGTNGMGWFPGYAINLSTGERLNIAFGEDSKLINENGRDMVWNPTNKATSAADPTNGFAPSFGGRHYVYIFGHNGDTRFDNTFGTALLNKRADVDKYDEGKSIYDILSYQHPTTSDSSFRAYKEVWKDAMYVGLNLLDSLSFINNVVYDKTNPKIINIPTETRVKFRVNEAFKYGYSGVYGNVPYSLSNNAPEVPSSKTQYTNQVRTTPENANLPLYRFTTEGIVSPKTTVEQAKSYLDFINVVPNPYYSSSEYELNRLETTVKITNLPEKCNVKIYTMNGQLVREFKVDNTNNKTEIGNQILTLDWDLKNFNNTPISSGLYLIHVDVPGVGVKIVKWFGSIRPLDLNSF